MTDAAIAEHAPGRLHQITILDPACGSGAFLVYALECVADRLRSLGDDRPLSDIRRAVLTRSIFGIDRNPMAVWLCELRLWLSVVIECDITDPLRRVPPLPNLDRNVRVGDALSGAAFSAIDPARAAGQRLSQLRDRYARATGARKANLVRMLDRAERARALALVGRALVGIQHERRERIIALRGARPVWRTSGTFSGSECRIRRAAPASGGDASRAATAQRRRRASILIRGALWGRGRAGWVRCHHWKSAMGTTSSHPRRSTRRAAPPVRRLPKRLMGLGRRSGSCRPRLCEPGRSVGAVRRTIAWLCSLSTALWPCWSPRSSGVRCPAAACVSYFAIARSYAWWRIFPSARPLRRGHLSIAGNRAAPIAPGARVGCVRR